LTNLLNIPEVSTVLNHFILDVFSDFIESTNRIRQNGTIKGYTTVKTILPDFQDATKVTLTWDNIDVKFIDKLKKYSFITEGSKLGTMPRLPEYFQHSCIGQKNETIIRVKSTINLKLKNLRERLYFKYG